MEVLTEIKIDEKKVKDLQKSLSKKQEEISKKVYGVSMDMESLDVYEKIVDDLEWTGKESLGIIEITNRITEIRKKGIKNNAIFMNALEIEASHYFLNRYKGKGKKLANSFIKIYKAFEQALVNIGADNKSIDDLKTELAAAQQGLKAE